MVRRILLAAAAVLGLAVGPLVALPAAAASPAFTSDDFSSGGLGGAPWTVVDPVGDGTVAVTGVAEQDARLVLSVPGGASHDPWNTNRALRVMQPAADVDLHVRARWATVPSLKYQMQGIIVEQDERNWLRFDVHHTGTVLRVFAGRTVDGVSSTLMSKSVPAGSVAGLEVVRTGATWSVSYDSGSGWTSIGSVSHALAVSRIGPFAGTAGTLPAWSSELDWFFDATSPIDPEDGAPAQTHVLSTSVVGSGSVTRSPDAASYVSGSVVELTAVPGQGWQFSGWSGDVTGSNPVTSVTVVADTSVTATFTEVPVEASPTGGPVSDDFSGGSLAGTWRVVDPAGAGAVSFAGLGTAYAHLQLSVPSGTSYDPWHTNRALRVMQDVADVDFQVAARFTSSPSVKYQQQGFMVEQDAGNWLRFDVYSNGTSWYVFGARTVNGSSSKLFSRSVTAGPEVTLRLARVGTTWTLEHSPDGQTWSAGGTATHALTVGAVGVFAGNGGSKPAFTASVDWFFDTANPIEPEDGSAVGTYPLTTSVTGGGAITRAPSAGSYPAGTVVTLTAEPAAGWQFSHWAGDASGSEPVVEVTMDGPKNIVAVFGELPSDPPTIDVWYGDEQVFGRNGQSQKWVNVLGNVSDENGVTALSYTLNAGPSKALRLGSDLRRLYGAGDFNVEIPYVDLLDGPNTVALTATDGVGDTSVRTVTVVKDVQAGGGSRVVDWSLAAQPDDVAQVVDGKWSTGPGGLTVQEMGYDRTVAIGDAAWTDYEVTVPMTVRGLGPGAGTPQSGVPLIGMGLRWNGHTPRGAESPAIDWWPTGAFAWYEWYGSGRFTLQGNEGQPLVRQSMAWDFATTYVMKAQVKTEAGGVRYSYKWWPQGGAEPAAWALSVLEDAGPQTGTLLLVAHHVDATFGSVTVTELP